MEKKQRIINFEYIEIRKVSLFYKLTSFLLVLLFVSAPLYDLIDVFHKELSLGGLCCLLPCPDPFSGYFFI